MATRDNYDSKAELKARGWTLALIASLLGKPHWTRRTNLGGESHLYLKETVRKAEGQPEFMARIEKHRKNIATKADQLERKLKLAIERARTIDIRIKQVERAMLIKTAVDAYNAYQLSRWCEVGQYNGGECSQATMPVDCDYPGSFIERVAVNFIRHNLTCYDRFRTIYSSEIYAEAVQILSLRITEAISAAYPWLAREAERQYQERYRERGAA